MLARSGSNVRKLSVKHRTLPVGGWVMWWSVVVVRTV